MCLAGLLCITSLPSPAYAQYWSFDARQIALGGASSGSGNIAANLVEEQRPYRSIVIPLGLIQVLGDFDTFNPDSDRFDPVRAAEYSVSPVHFVIGRDGSTGDNRFVTDLLNAGLSRDLNDYRGFAPATEIVAEGLANPSWGKTFKITRGDNTPRPDPSFHGIYVGAGPYLSLQTRALVDDALAGILDSPSPVYVPNSRFDVTNATTTQLALAFTGGYRARLALPAAMRSGGPLDGIYLAANYNYLRGLRYESFDSAIRFDTDSAGLLTLNPALSDPLRITRTSSTEGNGFSIDLGAGVVMDRWQFGFGANGLANRIDWDQGQRTLYQLESLFDGDGDFDDTEIPGTDRVRVELPVDYRGYVAYSTDGWSGLAEWANGFQGTTFRGGVEKRFARVELRGGARFARDRWEPSGGVGFNLSERFGVDVAAFGTSANVERKRNVGVAVSLRLMQRN
jgi:hypothetical protein